ncbi:FMN-binding protein [Schleiferilactobacillus harbinensis]|uniref:FMN-binding protein n=1 Tax=Schleiferilactobacillus harbinensis TaxID=304207 RepID=UPI00123A239C|nr:FMN-binding protein [Schleiferilactobacillus harbinensis]QEU48225.1 FMN-binding protein [Schleiferilactobacillus harbinensis]
MYRKTIGFLLALAVALAMVIDTYILFFKKPAAVESAAASSNQRSAASSSSSSSTTATAKQALKDGTYTGKSVDTPHGAVQLQIVVRAGRISQVTTLAYPNEERRSEQINAQALPILKEEVLKSQSASVQLVSGATETSTGFKDSLQNAINQAKESQASA